MLTCRRWEKFGRGPICVRNLEGDCDRAITDLGLQKLCTLTALRSLNLAWCNALTDQGVQSLSRLSALTTLNLTWCDLVTD